MLAAAGLLMVSLSAGCAGSSTHGSEGFAPVRFEVEGSTAELVVYGSLAEKLPRFDTTPLLDRFLYGPNDYGKTALRNPQGLALLGRRLLVCDQGHLNVLSIDLDTGRSLLFCDADDPPRCPVAVATAGAERAYVADTTLRAVLVYDSGGHLVEDLTPDRSVERTFRPCAVCVRDGTLYVGDMGDRCVQRYDLVGRAWLDPLELPADQPGFVAPTGLAIGENGRLLVVDAIRARVYRQEADGTWLKPLGRPGRGQGEFVRPKQIAALPGGWILVTDAGRQSVLVFNEAKGQYVTELYGTNKGWAGWTLPMGLVTIDAEQWDAAGADTEPRAEVKGLRMWIVVSDSLGGDSLTLIGWQERSSDRIGHTQTAG
jgi:hypothetical protein